MVEFTESSYGIFRAGDKVNVQVAGKGPAWTGPVTVERFAEGGIEVYRDVWYGRVKFYLGWDHVVGILSATESERNNLALTCPSCGASQ